MEKDKYLLGSLNTALGLLDTLGHCDKLSLADISARAGVNKSVAFRCLYTLEKNGFVEKTGDAQYTLGIKFLYYGNLLAARQDVVAIARPSLQQLAAKCKLAAHLSNLNRDRVVTIYKEESPYDIQVTARVGMNAPAYTTAMGRAILAHLPEQQLSDLLVGYKYRQYSPRSITSSEECRTLLSEVRRQGYATDYDDRFPGFGSVACPIFDHTGSVAAAVGLVGLAQTIQTNEMKYVADVKETAQMISNLWGYVERT